MTRAGVLLLLLIALLVPATLAGATASDVLLTPEGAVYAVAAHRDEVRYGSPLLLTVQDGEETVSYMIPGTEDGAFHDNAALAYDAESDTLFVVWLRVPSPTFSEVLFSSFRDGAFSEPTTIEGAVFHLRFNLNVAVTHWVNEEQEDGSYVRERGLNVHAIWWDQTGAGEQGRHAMISIRDGEVAAVQTSDLLNFVDARRNPEPLALPAEYDRSIFRAASVTVSPEQNGVRVIFGDWETNRFQKIEILPVVSDGVLSVPLGVWGGEIDAPTESFDVVSGTSPAILAGPGSSKGLALYYETDGEIHYVLHGTDGWSEHRTLATSQRISVDDAVGALRNLVAASE